MAQCEHAKSSSHPRYVFETEDFDLVDKIMHENKVDYAAQLGDNVDGFFCYDDQCCAHYERMFRFAEEYPKTVWLWGNHELSYILDRSVTGDVFCGEEYARRYQENFSPKVANLDGKFIFSHAEISQEFVEDYDELTGCENTKSLVAKIDKMDLTKIWRDDSPI